MGQWYLPGFEPPGFTSVEVLQRIKQASIEVEKRLHNRKDKGVRGPALLDQNRSYWVWMSDFVPECEGLQYIKKISHQTAVGRHRRKFLQVLHDLVAEGLLEVCEAGTRPRFRVRILF